MAKGKFSCDNCDGEHYSPYFRILVTRPTLSMPRGSTHLVGVVVDAMLDAALDAVEEAKVNSVSGATIRRIGI